MKFIVEMTRCINMAKSEWKETEIKRSDVTGLLENTKKLAGMYSELLKMKRKGWENILEKQQNAEKEESGS